MAKDAGKTSAGSLEAKFDRGEDVIDYFETQQAKAIRPRKSASAQYLVELSVEKQTVVSEPSGSYAGGVSRKGAATARTQSKNPKTGDYTKRREPMEGRAPSRPAFVLVNPGRDRARPSTDQENPPKKGEFTDVKKDGKSFKGVAQEPGKRRN
jgi:hypothetical protein